MKKQISTLWKKITASTLAFFGIGALTACYGAPPSENVVESFMVYGTVTSNNKDKKQLKNIKVYAKNNPENYVLTDENGYYQLSFDYADNQTIYFEDCENKIYKLDSLQVEFNETNVLSKDIELKAN